MAGNLDVSLILRAQDRGFSAEMSDSQQELRSLGQTARTTSSSMELQTAAMGRAATSARNLRGAVGQLGFQAQDLAIQLSAGVPLLTAFAVQAGQAASVFGPWGIAIGTGITVLGVLAAALMSTRDDMEALTSAQDVLSGTLADGVRSADDLAASYGELTSKAQQLERTLLSVARTEAGLALDKARGKASELIDEIQRVTLASRGLENLGLFGDLSVFTTGDVGAELQAERPLLEAIQRFRQGAEDAGASIVDLILKTRDLGDVQPQALELGKALKEIRDISAEAAKAEASLALISGTATAEQVALLNQSLRVKERVKAVDQERREIGRALDAQAREEERLAAEALRPQLSLLEQISRVTSDLAVERQRTALVGVEGGDQVIAQLERENELRAQGIDLSSELAQRYLGIADALDRQRDATKGLEEETKAAAASMRAAEREGVGFARAFGSGLSEAARAGQGLLGTLESIGQSLLDLISSRLLDVFAQQSGAPLGSFFGSLFAPSGGTPAAAAATGPTPLFPAGTLHTGGVVGEGGGPMRLVDPAVFAGAQRYHRGGMVLRPGEVPIIAQRGERITPAGQGGVPAPVVVINNHGGQVERRQSTGPRGESIETITIRFLEHAVARGDLDRAMATRYGARPAGR